MSALPTLVTDLALILAVAGITTLLCKKWKQPVIIGYILAGFLLGPVVDFIPTIGDAANIETLAEIGVIFMMFALGLEFDLHKMASVGVSAVASAVVQVGGMVVVGYLLAVALGWGNTNGLFLGGMLGMSSTIITIKAIEDAGMREQRFANLAIGTLIIEDIVAIFLMLILSTVAVSKSGDSQNLLLTILFMLLYLALWLCLGILLVPSVMRKLEPLMNEETLLVVSLGFCFVMVCLADALGFSSALGAFMAGSILAGSSISHRVEKMVSPLKDLFVAVFFVSVGMMVIPATILRYALPILLITVVTIAAKVFLLTLSMAVTGQDLSTSLKSATAQSQVGEFSFIIAGLGTSLAVTSDFLYPVIVAIAVITTFLTPFLLKSSSSLEKLLVKLLPGRLVEFMSQTAEEEAADNEETKQETQSLWGSFLKQYLITFAVNSIIIGAVILAGSRLLLPWMLTLSANRKLMCFLSCLAMYLCMGPFIPSLLIFRRTYFTNLWLSSKRNRFPLMVLMALRSIAAALAVALPLVLVFRMPFFLLALVAFPAAWLASRSGWLRGKYMQIASRFLANFNERSLSEIDRGDKVIWMDEKIWVGEFRCEKGSPIVGEKLMYLNWRKKMDVNVVKIIRGQKHLNIPDGPDRIHGGDRIFLLGSQLSLQNFTLYGESNGLTSLQGEAGFLTLRQFIDSQDDVDPEDQLLEYAIAIKKKSPLEGKSISEANLRRRLNCVVVGMAREGLALLDLDPGMVLRSGDDVWVLGGQQMAPSLFEMKLI